MTHAKFDVNQLMLTLIFGIWASELPPPRAWRMTEKARPDRVNLDELDNSNNLEDGRPSNSLLMHHVTGDKDFTSFKPQTPQCKKLKNEEFTSLTLRVTDQAGNVITNGPQVTVVLHICDCK